MDTRQVVRVVAVVVAAAALAFLGFRMVTSGDETVRPAASEQEAGTPYAELVVDLQSLLTAYSSLQTVAVHAQIHTLNPDLAKLELALRSIEERAEEIGADDVATLAATVRTRAAGVLAEASSDHTGLRGVGLVRAFGRETALRAVAIGDAVREAEEAGWGPVRAAVAEPWPAPEDEGQDAAAGP